MTSPTLPQIVEPTDGRSGAEAPSGSQASPGAPDGSPPSVSIPNALTLNYSDIRDIYYAGCQRGEAEATSFEWGSPVHGKWHDNLADALYEIVNEGQRYGEPGFHEYDAVAAWVADKEAEWAADIAQAIEARRAETRSGSVHESAVAESDAPDPSDRTHLLSLGEGM